MADWDEFYKKYRVSKDKAKTLKQQQDAKDFVENLESEKPKLTKKQQKDEIRRLQFELPLNVSHLYILDHPPKMRKGKKKP